MEFIKKSSKTDKQYTLKAQETENIIFFAAPLDILFGNRKNYNLFNQC